MWAGTLECRSSFTKAKLTLSHLQCIRLWMNTTSTFPRNSRFSLRQSTTFTDLTDLPFSTEEGWKGCCTTTDEAEDIWKTLSCPSPTLLGDCLTAHLSRATQSRSKQSLFICEWDSTSIFYTLVWDETHRADVCFHSASGLETNVGVLLPAHTKTTHKCNCWLEGSLQSYLHWVSNTVLLPEKNIARELKKLPTSLNSFRGAAGIRSSSK